MEKSSFYLHPAKVEALEDRIAPATIIVSNANDAGAGSLRQALIDADVDPGKDTVVFDKTFFATQKVISLASDLPTITSDIAIMGPGTANATIDGNGQYRIFNFDDNSTEVRAASVSGLTLTGGHDTNGGALSSKESLTLSHSVLVNNEAMNYGGGLYFSSPGKLTVIETRFIDNLSGFGGGGLFAASSGLSIKVSKSDFVSNTGGTIGGAMALVVESAAKANSAIIVDSCSVIDNGANNNGGGIFIDNNANNGAGKVLVKNATLTGNSGAIGAGIYLTDGAVTIDKVSITDNVSSDRGGGIGDNGIASLVIKNSRISSNTAVTEGGGLYLGGNHAVTIQNSEISGNSAQQSGGGIYAGVTKLVISASAVSANKAGNDGGAIANTVQDATISITKTRMEQNSATDDGGAISAQGANTQVILKSSSLSGNSSMDSGGGIYMNNTSVLQASANKFIDNNALYGGAINAVNNVAVTLTKNLFEVNKAGFAGGAFFCTSVGAGLSLVSNTFTGNTAFSSGAGFIDMNGDVTVKGNTFQANEALAGSGGAISFFGSGGKTLSKNKWLGNTAFGNGGAFQLSAGVLTVSGDSFIGNTASNTGGAIYNITGSSISEDDGTFEDNYAPSQPNIFNT